MIPKTSRAVILTARLNPINPEEANALRIIAEKKKQGYNFKQVIVDAINRCDGATPEMFTKEGSQTVTEATLVRFADKLLADLRTAAPQPERNIEESEQVSRFAKSFATGLLQRQQAKDEED